MRRYISLIGFVLLTTAAAMSGSAFEPGPWYDALAKPEWTPPGWLFGPVWSVLYVMIAVAGWLVWRAQGLGLALFIWLAQLIANGAWSYFMFGQNDIAAAMRDILLMWVLIAAFILVAWRISKLASVLFVPYLAWVTFAAALNFAILQMNT